MFDNCLRRAILLLFTGYKFSDLFKCRHVKIQFYAKKFTPLQILAYNSFFVKMLILD